jgi:hypothetical protein
MSPYTRNRVKPLSGELLALVSFSSDRRPLTLGSVYVGAVQPIVDRRTVSNWRRP